MKRFNWIVAAALLLAAMTPASAQKKKGQPAAAEKRIAAYAVGFYNLENLFDTIHAVGKKDQDFLPDALSGHKFYDPGNNARESEIRRRLQALWKKYNY